MSSQTRQRGLQKARPMPSVPMRQQQHPSYSGDK